MTPLYVLYALTLVNTANLAWMAWNFQRTTTEFVKHVYEDGYRTGWVNAHIFLKSPMADDPEDLN